MNRQATCAVHQPNFFPRLSTLAKLCRADVWVILDDVQFNARDYQHRTRLAALDNPNVQQWLTMSVHRPHGRASMINEILLAEPEKTQRRVSQLIRQYYGRSPYWPTVQAVADEVAAALAVSNRLTDIAEVSTRALLALFGWRGRVVRSSSFVVRSGRSERLADLTAAVGAAEYLCGTGGARYLSKHPFSGLGLNVQYMSPAGSAHSANIRSISSLWALAERGAGSVSEGVAPQ